MQQLITLLSVSDLRSYCQSQVCSYWLVEILLFDSTLPQMLGSCCRWTLEWTHKRFLPLFLHKHHTTLTPHTVLVRNGNISTCVCVYITKHIITVNGARKRDNDSKAANIFTTLSQQTNVIWYHIQQSSEVCMQQESHILPSCVMYSSLSPNIVGYICFVTSMKVYHEFSTVIKPFSL